MPNLNAIYLLVTLAAFIWGLKVLVIDAEQSTAGKSISARRRMMAAAIGARLCWCVAALITGLYLFMVICGSVLIASVARPDLFWQCVAAIFVAVVFAWVLRDAVA